MKPHTTSTQPAKFAGSLQMSVTSHDIVEAKSHKNQPRQAFEVFDKDRDGFISRDELRMIFAALPERLSAEEIEEMLEAADEDGNGSMDITF